MDASCQHTRANQRDRLLALLKSCAPNRVSLAKILAVAGAQYGARIYELRRLGHRIESKPGGGWFRLGTAPASLAIPESQPIQKPPANPESLFGDLAPEARYPD